MSKIDKIRHNRTTTMLLSQECYMNDGSDQLKMEVKAALNYMLQDENFTEDDISKNIFNWITSCIMYTDVVGWNKISKDKYDKMVERDKRYSSSTTYKGDEYDYTVQTPGIISLDIYDVMKPYKPKIEFLCTIASKYCTKEYKILIKDQLKIEIRTIEKRQKNVEAITSLNDLKAGLSKI